MRLAINLDEALGLGDATNGIGPDVLKNCVKDYLSTPTHPQIIVRVNSKPMLFFPYSNQGKTVIISADCLSSNCNPDEGVDISNLPEILDKLAQQKIQFDLLQFPHALRVKGWLTGRNYRAHFNHIIFSKSADKVDADVIDSTINPFGVSNPFTFGLLSKSIVSGEELLSNSISRLLQLPVTTIYTNKQPIRNDRRCGIYVLTGMTELANIALDGKELTQQSIKDTVTKAHQELYNLSINSNLKPAR